MIAVPWLVACALLGPCTAAVATAAEHRVVIDAMAFTPKVVHVKPGDTITWVNKDLFVHNVTADGAGISSGELSPGQEWRHTVHTANGFDYTCTLHPTMKGRVEVASRRQARPKK